MIFWLFLSFALLMLPIPAYAGDSRPVLNEIYATGSNGSNDWVEIYNGSDTTVNLKSWKLQDGATTAMKTFSTDTQMAPHSYLTIEVSNRLNNDGDTVKLIDSSDQVKDQFSYTSTTVGKSFARLPDGDGGWYETSTVTKNTQNPAAPATSQQSAPSTGKIFLSEFMPAPSGGDEWVEVYNPSATKIDLSGWKVDDIDGGSSPFSIPSGIIIDTGGYKMFSFSSKLNNSGDTLRLLDPSGKLVESFSYKKAEKGYSFAKDSTGAWKITTTPTPGKVNKITLAQGGENSGSTTGSSEGSQPESKAPTQDSSGRQVFNKEVGNYSGSGDGSLSGKVAGISQALNQSNKTSVLLISVGFSFLLTALAWPFVEKRVFKNKT